MTYASVEDLRQRLGEPLFARLTDRSDGTTADPQQAEALLGQAEAIMNTFLGRRYQLPLDPTRDVLLADMLRTRTLDLAEHLAWRQSPFISDMPVRVAQLHGDAMRWLTEVSSGDCELPAARPRALGLNGLRVHATPRRLTHEELDQI